MSDRSEPVERERGSAASIAGSIAAATPVHPPRSPFHPHAVGDALQPEALEGGEETRRLPAPGARDRGRVDGGGAADLRRVRGTVINEARAQRAAARMIDSPGDVGVALADPKEESLYAAIDLQVCYEPAANVADVGIRLGRRVNSAGVRGGIGHKRCCTPAQERGCPYAWRYSTVLPTCRRRHDIPTPVRRRAPPLSSRGWPSTGCATVTRSR